jgi:hypothetical protein
VRLSKKLRRIKNRTKVKGVVTVTDGPKKKIVKEIKVDLGWAKKENSQRNKSRS